MISSEEPRARLSIVSQISVAGALIACHLFIFQIIVHFSKQKTSSFTSKQHRSMDWSLLHISFLRLLIIRDTFVNKVNYALACVDLPLSFLSLVLMKKKLNIFVIRTLHRESVFDKIGMMMLISNTPPTQFFLMRVYSFFSRYRFFGRDQFHFGEGSIRFPKGVGLVKTSRPK